MSSGKYGVSPYELFFWLLYSFFTVIILFMARPLRIEYEGAVYHIILRGNNRRIIFKQDSGRKRFIRKPAESVL